MSIKERLQKLRLLMAERKIDAYLVTTADPHQSEYLCDYYKTREFISGFTGSAGTAVITQNSAGLWTDGRYTIQSKRELQDTEYEVFITTEPGTPSIEDYLKTHVQEFGRIGFDGKTMSVTMYKNLSESLKSQMLIADVDFIGQIWQDRPALPTDPAFRLADEYTGEPAEVKLERLRNKMRASDLHYVYLGALDEIAWLFNIRGSDIAFNPVVFAHCVIGLERAWLCMDLNKLDEEMKSYFSSLGVSLQSYDFISSVIKGIEPKKRILIDPNTTSTWLYMTFNANVRLVKQASIVCDMKAIKNATEIENLKLAYIKDGVALIKFFNWVETGAMTGSLTEAIACDKLHFFRQQDPDFLDESFATIAAYGENAAMPHYKPGLKSKTLAAQGFFLVDSGGQYYQGTTDITRTMALGPVSDYEQEIYTLVLKAHIALATACFKSETTGSYLDAFCRYPLWKAGFDFDHGTGHGVGYLLNVHEGPHRIARKDNGVAFKPGMITSIEPGLYIEGQVGVRTENIAVCVPAEDNAFGTFYAFDLLTYVPIDTRPVKMALLTDEELEWLNSYNRQCFVALAPNLVGDDLDYLEGITRRLERAHV